MPYIDIQSRACLAPNLGSLVRVLRKESNVKVAVLHVIQDLVDNFLGLFPLTCDYCHSEVKAFAKALSRKPATVGDYNWAFTCILKDLIVGDEVRYSKCNTVAGILGSVRIESPFDSERAIEAQGILDCCSMEFYRRLTAPYEDGCIEKNGDVF